MGHLKVIFVVVGVQTVLIFMKYADIKRGILFASHQLQIGDDAQILICKNDFLPPPAI
jgi:hypothetical protein